MASPGPGPKLMELERDLERALESGDHDRIAAVRRTIAAQFIETPAGAEASYKLGLDALFRRRNVDEAAEHFRSALKAKSTWSTAARTSLAIVLLRQGKGQQGMFELRKIASTTPPTIATAYAQGLLVLALRDANKPQDAEKAHQDHKRMLLKVAETASGEDKALAHFMLGMEYKIDGEREPAKKHLTQALALGSLPAREKKQAESALAEV